VRALVVFVRLFPFVLAFLLDRRRFLVVGRPRRRVAERHQERAARLTRTLADLGPTFIKLAQVFAARADILPEPYLTAIGTLTDRVPPLAPGEAERVIREELGRDVAQLCERF
jgi:predicted unusual protein kinase regulating ubiquinone biosynthesis (AarF/ABC1/UbiB family)